MFEKLKILWNSIKRKKAISLDEIASMSLEQIKKDAALIHPAGFYLLANRLFHEGNKDEAIFWFYVGSLRYRYYLSSIEDDPFHPEQELFGKCQFEVGTVILDYAGGDPEFWSEQVGRAIAWDHANDNIFFGKLKDPEALLAVRQSLLELQNKLIEEKDNMIRQRIENNAEVRVYMTEDNK